MFTIFFRFHGVHRLEVEGLWEARALWDKLVNQFSMMSTRP